MTPRDETTIAHEVAVAMLADHERVADEMLSAIAREVPEFPGIADSARVRSEVRELCDVLLTDLLSGVVRGVEPEALDTSSAEAAATRYLRDGGPIEALLHAYRVGHRVALFTTLRSGEQVPGGRAAVVRLVEPSMRHIDAVNTAVANVYVRGSQRTLSSAARVRRDIMELLLANAPNALQVARGAGIVLDPAGTHVLLVGSVATTDDPTALQALEEAVIEVFQKDCVLAVIRHHTLTALLRGTGEGAVERAEEAIRLSLGELPGQASVGIGLPTEGLGELARAREQAMVALGLTSNEQPAVGLAGMPASDYLVATADAVARSMVPDDVRALARSNNPSDLALVQTLRVYLSSGLNVQRTAKLLPAHPNTVHDRLRRLAAKTGCNVRDAEQLVRLSIELRLAAD
jgi:hypothetical protein